MENKYSIKDLDIIFSDTEEYPIVGILIPCYNHGHLIQTALNSVAKQDYPNKLIIIIDDCSTDGSRVTIENMILNKKEEIENCDGDKILQGELFYCTNADVTNFDGQLLPIVFIKLHKNQKQAHARNVGIATTYEICDCYAQLDADDEYLPNKLSKCIEVMKEDIDNIGIIYHDVIIRNKVNGITTEEYREPYSYDRLVNECIICNTALINKKAISQTPYENISPVEDWSLWLDIAYSYMCIHIPEFLSIYNVESSSCTFTVDKSVWNDSWKKIREKIAKRHNLNLG